jgi:preprotein translocase subunit SecE
MANSAVVARERETGIKSWPERTKSFYNDVRTEMRKVTTPSRKDVQATTTVVLIAVFLFGLYFWVIDNVIGRGVDYMFRFFAK